MANTVIFNRTSGGVNMYLNININTVSDAIVLSETIASEEMLPVINYEQLTIYKGKRVLCRIKKEHVLIIDSLNGASKSYTLLSDFYNDLKTIISA